MMKKLTFMLMLSLSFFWQANAQQSTNSIGSWRQYMPDASYGERNIFKGASTTVNPISAVLPCNQETLAPTNIEDGYADLAEVQVANDLVIPADQSFTMESLHFNSMVEAGFPVQTVDVFYYSDSGNGPGTLMGSVLDIVPSTITFHGIVNGYDHLTVAVDFTTPIEFTGNSLTTIYWIGIKISYGGGNSFMEITNSNLNTPNQAYIYNMATQAFLPGTVVVGGDPGDGVLSIYGNCEDLDVCNGAPTAGTVSGPNAICSGIDFVLDVAGFSQGQSGLTYQWQNHLSGGNWQDIAGENGFELVQNISEETAYRFVVQCGSGSPVPSNAITVTLKPVNECHCIPEWQAGCMQFDDFIKDFILVGENSTELRDLDTSCPPANYDDRTNQTVDLAAGSEYTAEIASGASDDFVAVWIDFNDNGVYDSDELVGSAGPINGNLQNLILNIPANAPQGQYRMRVFLHYWVMPTDPCVPAAPWGMARDYSVNVVAPLSVIDNNFSNFSYYPNPTQGLLNLKSNNTIEQVVLYNLLGQQLLTFKPEARETQINLQVIATGTYIMKVVVDGSEKSFKIVKK